MARHKGIKEKHKRKRTKPPSTKMGPKEEKIVLKKLLDKSEGLLWEKYERVFKLPGGPPLFEHPVQLLEATLKYFEWSEANPIPSADVRIIKGKVVDVGPGLRRPFTLINFCHFCGVTEGWLLRYIEELNKKKAGPCTQKDLNQIQDFCRVIEFVRESCRNQQVNGAMVGQFNANIVARLNGLKDSVDMTSNGETVGPVPAINVYNIAPPLAGSEGEVEQKRLTK
jgi:hypothetical protein